MTSKTSARKIPGTLNSYDKDALYIFLIFLMFGMSFIVIDSLIWEQYISQGIQAAGSGYDLFVKSIFFLASIMSGILVSVHIRRAGEMQSALEESEKKFRTISERISDLIFVLDQNMEIIYANPAVIRVLGYSNDELGGRKPYDGLHPDDVELLRKDQDSLLCEDTDRSIRLRVRHNNKSTFSIIEFRGFHDDRDGKRIYYMIGRDVTSVVESRGREKAAIEQINQNLGQLAVLNDHIRNPLAVIVAYADMMEGKESEAIMEQAYAIDKIIYKLDLGWVESAKIRKFLVKHYNIG